MATRKTAGTPATVALAKAGVPFVVHEYEHDPANTHFGDESVAALGVEAHRVFKTLVAQLVGGREATVCAVVPVAHQLDLKALAQTTGAKKATMADAATAERLTGYVVGVSHRSATNANCWSTWTPRRKRFPPFWSRVDAEGCQLRSPLTISSRCSLPASPG